MNTTDPDNLGNTTGNTEDNKNTEATKSAGAFVPTGDLVDLLESTAAQLALRAAPESGITALEWAEILGRTLDMTEAALAALAGRVDAERSYRELGYASLSAWLRERLGSRKGRASERVSLSRQLPRLPRVADLLTHGRLSFGYAVAICDAIARLDDEDAAAAEEILLDMVVAGCTVGQVDKAAGRITDLIRERRGDTPEPADAQRGFKRSWIQHSRSLDGGGWLKGWLTPEDAAAFCEIVDPLAKPKAKGDERDTAQRTADALMAILTEGNKGAGVTIIVDLLAFLAAQNTTTSNGTSTGTGTDAGTGGAGDTTSTSTDASDDAASGAAHGAGDTTGTESGTGNAAPGTESRPWNSSTGAASAEGDTTSQTAPNPWTTETPQATSTESTTATQTTPDGPATSTPATSTPATSTSATSTPATSTPATGTPVSGTGSADNGQPSTTPTPTGSGSGSGSVPGDGGRGALWVQGGLGWRLGAGRVPARLLDGTPVSIAHARRVALAGGVHPLLLGEQGMPLRLGRKVRFTTGAQRRTLLALYDTCAVHGCQIPAKLCEIHHLGGGWKLGTPTDIEKLAPACRFHNQWVEDHADRIEEVRDVLGRVVITIHDPWKIRTDSSEERRKAA